MKIREAKTEEAEEITAFLSSVFQKKSLNLYCSNLSKKLANERYRSFVACKENRIIGHFGITILDNGALFNMMAIMPEFRERGLSRKLLQAAISYAHDRGDINHVAGYCVLQHPHSERIHDSTFKPVGLMVTQNSPLVYSDPLGSSRLFNGNLAVCKTIRKCSNPLILRYNGYFRNDIQRILSSIDVNVEFENGKESEVKSGDYVEVNLKGSLDTLDSLGDDFVCLGMLPNLFNGFYNFGFISRSRFNPQGIIEVRYDERKRFIEDILKNVS